MRRTMGYAELRARALARAREERLDIKRLSPTLYKVGSRSRPGHYYHVTIDPHLGAVCDCSGSRYYGICTHAAAVELAREQA